MANGMDGFYELLGEINKLSAWVMPSATIAPLIASLVDLNPPWPNKIGLTIVTALVVLLALIVVFQFLRKKRRAVIDRVLLLSLAFLVASCVAYYSGLSLFSFTTPVTHDRYIKGFDCTKDARAVFADKCPWLDLDELKQAEYEATRLWTIQSITVVRIGLLTLWAFSFAMLALALGAFISFQQRPHRQRVPTA